MNEDAASELEEELVKELESELEDDFKEELGRRAKVTRWTLVIFFHLTLQHITAMGQCLIDLCTYDCLLAPLQHTTAWGARGGGMKKKEVLTNQKLNFVYIYVSDL